MNRRMLLVAALGAACGGHALAQVDQVDPATLATTDIETFDNFLGDTGIGRNYDTALDGLGIHFGERFAGQTQQANGVFDTITGDPTNQLTIAVGVANQNLDIIDLGGGANVLTGVGPLGFPSADAVGEGAVSILFDASQFEMGLTVVGADSGDFTLSFFRQDGSEIHTIVLPSINGEYAFRRAGNVADIGGVLITNTDLAGMGYEDVRYTSIPAPSGAAVLALMAFGLRRRRQA